jgi:hypothetical protein
MNDKLPSSMVQSFSENIGKTAVFIIESEKPFPSSHFKAQQNKAQRDNMILFTKMFNGTLSVTTNYIQLNNSSAIHKPKFDIGIEIELDFILTLTMKNGNWFMNYFDKATEKAIDMPFHGFMYNG